MIYWAWNNTLSVLQQSVIMHKNGAKIELFDNLKRTFVKPKRNSRRSSSGVRLVPRDDARPAIDNLTIAFGCSRRRSNIRAGAHRVSDFHGQRHL